MWNDIVSFFGWNDVMLHDVWNCIASFPDMHPYITGFMFFCCAGLVGNIVVYVGHLIFGCTDGSQNVESITPTKYINISLQRLASAYIVTIDSCEYIMTDHGICHKQNCKYCAERNRK